MTDPAAALSWIQPADGEDLDEITELFNAAIEQALPELARDPELSGELAVSTRAQVRAFTVWMSHGAHDQPSIPAQSRSLAQTLARRGMDAEVLAEIHRATQHALLRYLTTQSDRLADRDQRVAQLVLFIEQALRWLNTSVNLLVRVHQEERERMFAGDVARRAALVRSILFGEPVDAAAASRALGYPMSGHHTALVIGTDDRSAATGADTQLTAAARTFAAHLDVAHLLTVPSGAHGTWAWLGSSRPIDAARLTTVIDSHPEVAAIRTGIGITGHGLPGFIRSHREAVAAQQISLATGQGPAISHYADVELRYLVSADREAYAAFRSRTLAGLDGADAGSGRLRETLRTYIRCGRSREATAAALDVHKNTVRYRLDRIRELLGHDVDIHIVELQLALLGDFS